MKKGEKKKIKRRKINNTKTKKKTKNVKFIWTPLTKFSGSAQAMIYANANIFLLKEPESSTKRFEMLEMTWARNYNASLELRNLS